MSWLCPYFNERVWAAILNAPMLQAQFSWKVTYKLQEHRVDLSGEKLTYSWSKKRFFRGDLQNDKKTAIAVDTSGWSKS